MRFTGLIWLMLISGGLLAQNDTLRTLGFDAFISWVQEHHPVARAADLKIESAEAILQRARGGFDPELNSSLSQKRFEDKDYYEILDAGLRVPTRLGVEVNTGYSFGQGQYLNPESSTSGEGLLYAGLRVPLLQGLLMDKRREQVQKAMVYQDLASAERELLINDLYLEAGSVYWAWFSARNKYAVFSQALDIAEQRFLQVKSSAELGDRPFIDTLEASIQIQNRTLDQVQAKLDLTNATIALEAFLWYEGNIPVELGLVTLPQDLDSTSLLTSDFMRFELLDSVLIGHPLIESSRAQVAYAEISEKLKKENLKPKLDAKYNVLRTPSGDLTRSGFAEDYSFGLDFSMPIFIRKSRADLRLARIKVQESQLRLGEKEREVRYKAQALMNELDLTAQQAILYEKTVRDYRSLWLGERELFEAGESSLFMINSRELGYIRSLIKQIDLLAKNRLSGVKAAYSVSNLNPFLP